VKLFANFPTLREVSVITNYSSPERRMLEKMTEDPAKQDSVLISQEKMKALEEQKKKEAEEKAEKEKLELERVKQQLEREHSTSETSATITNENKVNTDTVR
jgi:hypothetical protein